MGDGGGVCTIYVQNGVNDTIYYIQKDLPITIGMAPLLVYCRILNKELKM
jgi:hypothetical protein